MINEDDVEHYYCVKTPLSEDGEIYLMAKYVLIGKDGSLILDNPEFVAVLVLPAGNWSAVYAASVIDGSPVSIEHWKGEIIEEE